MNHLTNERMTAQSIEFMSKHGAFLTTIEEKPNAMVIGWGQIGFMWGKQVFVVVVRGSRYTHEAMGMGKGFGVSIPAPGELKDALRLCGSKSGRDMDKLKEGNIAVKSAKGIDAPMIDHCRYYYECVTRGVFEGTFGGISQELVDKWYPDGDAHTIYFGEIIESYEDKSSC